MPAEVSLLTPHGRGAVATIVVRGAGACEVVARCFTPASGRSLESLPWGAVAFGRLALGEAATEEAVVGVLGPQEVEVHCHGGVAVAEAVCKALALAGAVRIAWQDWLSQSLPDPISAAALLALPLARTERTAAILLDQHRGALRSEWAAIDDLLGTGQIQLAIGRTGALLARSDIGLHLAQPWRVVLAGRPNAGKSSLLNALLGYQRAIVFEQPGTTRDVVTATTAIDGWPIELADTAGLRTGGDAIESAGVARAGEAIAAADLVLLVAETTEPWDAGLYEPIAAARRVLLVHNKCDLAAAPADGRPDGVVTSAKNGAGLSALGAAVASALVPDPPLDGAAIPFTLDQIAALQAAQAHIANNHIAAARAALTTDLAGARPPGPGLVRAKGS